MSKHFLTAAALGLIAFRPLDTAAAVQQSAALTQVHEVEIPSLDHQRVHVEVHLPPGYSPQQRYPVLYLNDGQDAAAIHLATHLQRHFAQNGAVPRIVVAVSMLPDRMGTYGLADVPHQRSEIAPTRYGDVGRSAFEYTQWFTQTLVAFIDTHYATQAMPQGRAVLGWSLGAVAAFSSGWQRPDQFGRIGMFSPSLWLSAARDDLDQQLRTRLVQQRVANDPLPMPTPAIYLAVGSNEDSDDRDGDGINDPYDDVLDLAGGWQHMPGLAQRGVPYRVNLLVGGQHQQAAWSQMLPRFLRWLDAQDHGTH